MGGAPRAGRRGDGGTPAPGEGPRHRAAGLADLVRRAPDAPPIVGEGPERGGGRSSRDAALDGCVTFDGDADPSPHLHGAQAFPLALPGGGLLALPGGGPPAGRPAVCTDVGGEEPPGAAVLTVPSATPGAWAAPWTHCSTTRRRASGGLRPPPRPPGGSRLSRVHASTRPLRIAGRLMCGIAGILAAGAGPAGGAPTRAMAPASSTAGRTTAASPRGRAGRSACGGSRSRTPRRPGTSRCAATSSRSSSTARSTTSASCAPSSSAHGYAFRSRLATPRSCCAALRALGHGRARALQRHVRPRARRRAPAPRARSRATASARSRCSSARLRGGVPSRASSSRCVARRAGASCRSTREALAEYFRFQYVPAPRTIFREVRQAAAGELGRGRPRQRAPRPARPRSGACPTAADAAGARPRKCCDDVRAAVRAPARRRRPGRRVSLGRHRLEPRRRRACATPRADVRTFSIGFADPRFDESRYAQAVARAPRHPPHAPAARWADAMDARPRARRRSYDEPFADSSALPTLAVSRLAREHVTVALSGDGGDELFGGYTATGRAAPSRWPRVLPRRVAARCAACASAAPQAAGSRLLGRSPRRRRRRAVSRAACPSGARTSCAGSCPDAAGADGVLPRTSSGGRRAARSA